MKLYVRAKPGAHEEHVEQKDPTHFVVSVREPPEKGLANRAIIAALARHLRIKPSHLVLRSGFSSRDKTIDII